MAARKMSQQELDAALARLRADPEFQRMLQAPAPQGNEALKNQSVNNFIWNNPRSPLAGRNAEATPSGDARGSYRYDSGTGTLKYVDTYGHPTAMKIVGLAATGGLAGGVALGALPAVGSATTAAASAAPAAATTATASGMPAVGIAPELAGYGLPASLIAENARGPLSPSDYLGMKPPRGGGRNGIGNGVANGANALSPYLQSAIAALAGLPALMANNGPSAEEKALMDEARQMQAMQRQRIQSQNPLFDAVTQLAMSRLPGSVQRG